MNLLINQSDWDTIRRNLSDLPDLPDHIRAVFQLTHADILQGLWQNFLGKEGKFFTDFASYDNAYVSFLESQLALSSHDSSTRTALKNRLAALGAHLDQSLLRISLYDVDSHAFTALILTQNKKIIHWEYVEKG